MKTIPITISNEDYEWLSSIATQREMTVAGLIEEMVTAASARADKETQWILKNPAMKKRLEEAMKSEENIPFEMVRERLGI